MASAFLVSKCKRQIPIEKCLAFMHQSRTRITK